MAFTDPTGAFELDETSGTFPVAPHGHVKDHFRRAMANLDEAENRGSAMELVQALLPVARCYNLLGDHEAAEDALRQALRAARRTGTTEPVVRALIECAHTACLYAERLKGQDAPGARARRERSRDRAFEASTLIHKNAKADWAAEALLAVSDVLRQCGDHDDADALRTRAAAWMAGT